MTEKTQKQTINVSENSSSARQHRRPKTVTKRARSARSGQQGRSRSTENRLSPTAESTQKRKRTATQSKTKSVSQSRNRPDRRSTGTRNGRRGHSGTIAIKDNNSTPISKASDSKLKIYALGGNEEVGRNCTVFEWGNDIIILDVGLQFPEEDMPGVDYIIPNIESLKAKKKNIRAIILSHGHLDHIGAIPYVMEDLGHPTIVGSDMTLALVKRRWEEFNFKTKLNTIRIKEAGQEMRFGKFKVNFFEVAHSVLEAFGVVVQTPFVNVIHMGDWRYDLDPVEGPPTDFSHLARWNTKTVPSLIMFESLGATHPGHQDSEREVNKNIEQLIKNAPGRMIVATFSSALERIGQVMQSAEKLGRKVAIDGFSMKAAVEIGKEFGFIKIKPTSIIDIKDVGKYPDKKICIICTGSQADERSVLVRIANKEHRHIRIEPNDTVIFSSSVIPGNERTIQRLKDSLYRQGANVAHKELMNVHAGGHAKQEDIKLLLRQTKPKYVSPVFANHYILREAEKIVLGEGFDPKNVFVTDNGQIVEFSKRGLKVTDEKVNTDYVFVDGLGIGDVSHIVLRDRKMLADDGMVVVIATIRKRDGKLIQNPDVVSRGFIHLKENKDLVEAMRRKVKTVVMKNYDPRTPAQEMFIKNKIRNDLGQFIFTKTERRPMVLPVIIEV